MARISFFTPSALLLLIAMAFVIEKANAGGPRSLNSAQCPSACNHRCAATSHRKPCLYFCNKCCAKCLCVPSGTYGHRNECPCYKDWKTKRGGPKCP